MGRRIRWMGAIMVVCLGLVVVQLVNIQLVKGKQLANSPNNPRLLQYSNARGTIYAADGTVLAKSVSATNVPNYPYKYIRQYPLGPLYAGITGYAGSRYFGIAGDAGIEEQYNAELSAHQPGPQNLSQLLFRERPPTTTDNVTLTVEPALQQVAWNALTTLPPGENKDGAVVVLNPKTGAVLAMVSNPTFDPNGLVASSVPAEQLAYGGDNQKDHEGFEPLRPIATREFFQPGSTMKVVTSTAVYNLKPQLSNFAFANAPCLYFPTAATPPLCNDAPTAAGADPCGGTMTEMLPASCDPGYGALGIQLGESPLLQQSELFGYNAVPDIDLPDTLASTFKPFPEKVGNQRLLADASIGQNVVSTTALQNAMVAAGMANGGVVMTPHLMASIHDSEGNLVQSYTPKPMPRSASAATARQVTSLMEGVVAHGTASGVGFPSYLCAAVKTGTAQTGLGVNHDWMIGFAPANNPQIAVAVVVPYQQIGTDGAQVAGPIVNTVMQAALPPGSVSQPCNV
jgi:peptidoglycan glycosyltransferase